MSIVMYNVVTVVGNDTCMNDGVNELLAAGHHQRSVSSERDV